MLQMKRKFVLALAAMMSMTLAAQTEFRQITYEEALATAKTENKLVFIDFYTDWCGPCKMMMNKVFPQKVVGDFINSKFVPIKLNAEKEGKPYAEQFKVKAYPTFIVVNPNGDIIMTKEGGDSDGVNFITSIERQIDPEKTPERLKERYESGERTADFISSYAGMLLEDAYEKRGGDAEKNAAAFDMLQSYFNSLTDSQKVASETRFYYPVFTESPRGERAS